MTEYLPAVSDTLRFSIFFALTMAAFTEEGHNGVSSVFARVRLRRGAEWRFYWVALPRWFFAGVAAQLVLAPLWAAIGWS